jgi:two-component system CheB/CheR fusion protein
LQAYEEVKKAEDKLRRLNASLEQRVEERTKELYESEERLRLVSRATNDAVWDWNLVSNELWWNEGFQKLFGYSEEEITPDISSWFHRLHQQEKDKIVKSIYEAIDRGDKQWTAEHRFLKADGTYSYVYNRGYILENENGEPIRMLGSMVDLTGLRQVQEDLEESNVNLRKINTVLDNFVYTASHDLKAPVTNLEGLINLLIPKLKDKLDPKEQRVIEMIKASVDKLNRTIQGLLEITRVQKDLERKIDRLDFEEVLQDVRADVEPMIQDCDAEIETNFEVGEIFYARYNLRSIMYNLLSNALKYCSAERKPHIQISTRQEKEYIVLSFADNGLGMNEKQQAKLFSMFKRFHTQVEGTGIGLYMVKRIVENNEGSIEVESQENKGTTFRVYLKDMKTGD